jgi:hypothetical protein
LPSCPHLELIEVAMRARGIPIKTLGRGVLQANCRIHRSGLQAQFSPLELVVYVEHQQGTAELRLRTVPLAHRRAAPFHMLIERTLVSSGTGEADGVGRASD